MKSVVLCVQCDKPERECTCDHYCCYCQGLEGIRFCADGKYTVRIAGKHATFVLQILMTDESTRVEFHLDRDARLISAVRSAVQFQASRAGSRNRGLREYCHRLRGRLQGSAHAIDGCRRGTRRHARDVSRSDRNSIYHRGQLVPAVGLETFAAHAAGAGGAGGLNGTELLSRVDRVMFNTEEGVARTTLVKFLQPKR